MNERRRNYVPDPVAMRVVGFLGWSAILGLLGVIHLVRESIQSANEIDPSTVALVAGVSTLAGTAFGALGSMLSHTGKPPVAPPQEVTVVNDADDPVPVEPGDA